MKKLIVFISIIIVLVSVPLLKYNPDFRNDLKLSIDDVYRPPERSREELYKDIFITLLDPYIEKAITEYYGFNHFYAPYHVDILNIERPNGYRTFLFLIKLKVMPYVGAHNTIGTDHITFRVSAGGEVIIEKFEHIKDHPLPPHLKHYRILTD